MSIPVPPPAPGAAPGLPGMPQPFVPLNQHAPNTGRAVPTASQSGPAGRGDLPFRVSDVQPANPEPTFESYTFRKAESSDPQQKKSWARYTINETPIPAEDLKRQVQKQKQKNISVWDQYKKLDPRRQTMIDNFIEEKKGQEKDRRFERKLASVTTEERKVGRLGYETASIHIILKRQLRPIVTNQRVGSAAIHHDAPRELNGSLPPRHFQGQALPAHSAFEPLNMRPNPVSQPGNRGDIREQFGPVQPRPGPSAGMTHQVQPNPQQHRPQQPNMVMRGSEPQIVVMDDGLPPPPPLPPHPQAGQGGPPRQAASHGGLRHQPSQPQFQPVPQQQRPLSRNGNQFPVLEQQTIPQPSGQPPFQQAPQQQRPQSRNGNQFPVPQEQRMPQPRGQPPFQPAPQQQRPQSRNGDQFPVPQEQRLPQQRVGQPPLISHQQPRPHSRNGQAPATLPQQSRPQSRNEHHTRSSKQDTPRGSVPQGPQRGYSVRRPSTKQRQVEEWLEDEEDDVVDSDEFTEDETVFTEATSLDEEFDVRPIKVSSRRGSLNRRHSRSSDHEHGGRRGPVYREHSRRRPTASSDRNGSISPHYPRGDFEIYPEINRTRHPPNVRRQSFAARQDRPAYVPHTMSYEGDRYDPRELPRLIRGPPYGALHQSPQRRLPEAPYTADFINERQQRVMREAQIQQHLDHMEALHLGGMEAAEQWDRSPILEEDPRRFLNRAELGSRRLSGGYFPSMAQNRFDHGH
ncbi:MAG: hypothetical protein M1812_004294 [Candelaria pacifica]|nr:MAG: hypothetical protein M1812_004294 [Candelaria pacifica]